MPKGTLKWIRFVPVEEEGVISKIKPYLFQANVAVDETTGTLDIDMVFDSPAEEQEYNEFQKIRKAGQEFYLDIPEL